MYTCHRANLREISSDCEPTQLALPTGPPLALPVHWMIRLSSRLQVGCPPRPETIIRYEISYQIFGNEAGVYFVFSRTEMRSF